ncbi:hypothetical protein AB6813_01550 [bacterium RCC_150]
MDWTPWTGVIGTIVGTFVGAGISIWSNRTTTRRDRMERIAELLYEAERVRGGVKQLIADKLQGNLNSGLASLVITRASEIDAALASVGRHAAYLELTEAPLHLRFRILVLQSSTDRLKAIAAELIAGFDSEEDLDFELEEFEKARDRLIHVARGPARDRPSGISFSRLMRRFSSRPRWDAKPTRRGRS